MRGPHRRTTLEVSRWSRGWGFYADLVVDRILKPLFTTQIALGCLDRYVPEQKLNLLKFTSGLMAKPGAGSTQIVRSNYADAAVGRRFTNYGPNNFSREPSILNSSGLAYGAEENSILQLRCIYPRIDG